MTTIIDPGVYQLLVIAMGLEFYAKTRRCINRSYTPKRMMAMAERLTGQKFKSRDYIGAARALRKEREHH